MIAGPFPLILNWLKDGQRRRETQDRPEWRRPILQPVQDERMGWLRAASLPSFPRKRESGKDWSTAGRHSPAASLPSFPRKRESGKDWSTAGR